MKKHFPMIIGASIITGFIGSLLIKKNDRTLEPSESIFGDWTYQKIPNGKTINLTVTPNYQVYFQGKLEPTTLIDETPTRLTLLDKLGYQIIFELTDQQVTFYDETEDQKFPLTKRLPSI
ncbi:MAG: DUF4828 domain-containing protein [Enterococcus sp.]